MKAHSKTYQTFGSFLIGEFEMALSIETVQEVVNFPSKLTPVPRAPDFLLGLFDLRGMIIPVIHLAVMLDAKNTASDLSLKKIAVVNYDQKKIGIVFDSTHEILKIPKDQFTYQENLSKEIVAGILKLDNGSRLVQLLNTDKVMALESVSQILSMTKTSQTEHSKVKENKKRLQAIGFFAGAFNLALPMDAIYEIIQLPKLEKSFVNYAYSKGLINLRGMMIPVIDFGKFLTGRENVSETFDPKIIIVNLSHEFKIGLLVDIVVDIISYTAEDVLTRTMVSELQSECYSGMLKRERDILLLSTDKLLVHPEISKITIGHAKLYQEHKIDQRHPEARGKRETYISFKIGAEYSFPILDIQEIIECPQGLTAPLGAPAFVVGLHDLRGQIVTMIDLEVMKGKELSSKLEGKKVIVLKQDAQLIGLVVDSVEDIFFIYAKDKYPCPDILKTIMDHSLGNIIREFILINDGKDVRNRRLVVLDSVKFFDPSIYKASS